MEIAFGEIRLVDAEGVDPEEAGFVAVAKVREEVVEVAADVEGVAVYGDWVRGGGGVGGAPGVGDGGVGW